MSRHCGLKLSSSNGISALLLAGVLKAVRDRRKRILQLPAEVIHHANYRDRYPGGDEAILDRRRAAFVAQETLEARHV